ncbi:MAG: HAD-IIIA family hydrolase [Bacteroidetes bacterium]|nr:HAD-IIIA family hydrolase [Bacteroidota bacterium]MBU1719560.1 HAD-IIIA family hydrolase [Bacteroidota bacterium]
MRNFRQLLPSITTMIFDCDGVLTNGTIIITQTDQLRTMHVRDGYAMQYAIKKGYRIVILSGGRSESIRERLETLGIRDVFLGIERKIETFKDFVKQNDLSTDEILYMGDDIPDYEVMKQCGVACCPADAAEEIKSISHYISPVVGGKGCVRDIIEQVMKIRGDWMNDEAFSW